MNLNNLFGVFKEFETSIEEIRKYTVDVDKTQNQLLKTNTFYNGLIISLYGAFEKFVDDIGNDYLDIIFNCKATDKDQARLIKRSLLVSFRENLGDFLANPNRHTDIENTTENLSRIFSSYLLALTKEEFADFDKKLFMIHGANMRSDILFDFFRKLRIENLPVRVCAKKPFRDFVINELGIEEHIIAQIQTQTTSDIYLSLNRLVEERNIIAHTGKSENKISLREISTKTIPFLLHFCESITKCVGETLISSFDIEYKKSFENNCIKCVFNNCILCHENESQNIKINNYFVIYHDCEYKISRVISIELDKRPLKETGTDNKIFGFKIDDSINNNSQLISYL